MLFDRALDDTEHVGYLLIGQAAHHERKYLALAWRQAFVSSTPFPLVPLCLLLGGSVTQVKKGSVGECLRSENR